MMATIACATWLVPTPRATWAASQVPTSRSDPTPPPIRDVAMRQGGRLAGRVIRSDGQPVPGQTVAIRQNGVLVAQLQTDASGQFALEGLPAGGLYQVETEGARNVYRVWSSDAAPPGVEDQVTLVVPQAGVPGGPIANPRLRTQTVIAGLVLGAAIAIPIAVKNSRNDLPLGS